MPGTYRDLIWQHDPTLDAAPRYRRACGYRAFIPEPLATLRLALDSETVGAVSRAESAISALNSQTIPALKPLARLLLRAESIASSKVEGLHLRVRDLARAEARSDSGEKVAPTAVEILANIDAMEVAIGDAAAAPSLTTAQVIAIHSRLMKASATTHIAGRIRDEQNWIGGNDYNPCGADFVPPPPGEMKRLMADLWGAANDDTLPPIVQAALVHAQFETIHPFADGNGRAGRALIHVILKRRGLSPTYVPPISVILAKKRDGYIAGLTDFRGDHVAKWIRRFADAAAVSAELAREYVVAVEEKADAWRGALIKHGAPRSDAAAWAILNVLPAHPMITSPAAIAATGRARAAVHQGLEQLESAGVLKLVSAARRNRVWEATGLLDLIEGLEAGRLPPASR